MATYEADIDKDMEEIEKDNEVGRHEQEKKQRIASKDALLEKLKNPLAGLLKTATKKAADLN